MQLSSQDSCAVQTLCDQVQQYLSTVDTLPTLAFAQANAYGNELDQHLSLRTYLAGAGHGITAADFAVWGAIRSSSVLMGLIKKGDHTHLARWFSHMDNSAACSQAMEEIVAEKNSKTVSEGRSTPKSGVTDSPMAEQTCTETSGIV